MRALAGVSLEVREGELFTLLGPSGCGKTTTLRCIAGFERPTSGRIEFQGQDFTSVPPFRRGIGMVFQSYALFPHLSVFENVAYGLRGAPQAAGGDPPQGRRAARPRWPGEHRPPQAGRALGGPAAAHRAGPRPGLRPEAAAARRAAQQPRRQAAHLHARGDPPHPAAGRGDRDLRDPRPGGGALDLRPDRGDARGPGEPDRHARRDLREPVQRAGRGLHRTGELFAVPRPERGRRAPPALRLRGGDAAARGHRAAALPTATRSSSCGRSTCASSSPAARARRGRGRASAAACARSSTSARRCATSWRCPRPGRRRRSWSTKSSGSRASERGPRSASSFRWDSVRLFPPEQRDELARE